MIKFVINFRQAKNPQDFENSYNNFLALVERMPLIQRRQAVHVTGSPQGQAPYTRALEIYFADENDLRNALLSPAGQEAGNELSRFDEGSFDVFFAEVFEEAGGSTQS